MPFSFAAGGTSPVWVDGCSTLVDDQWVFTGCPVPMLGSSTTSSGSGGSPATSAPTPSMCRSAFGAARS